MFVQLILILLISRYNILEYRIILSIKTTCMLSSDHHLKILYFNQIKNQRIFIYYELPNLF